MSTSEMAVAGPIMALERRANEIRAEVDKMRLDEAVVHLALRLAIAEQAGKAAMNENEKLRRLRVTAKVW